MPEKNGSDIVRVEFNRRRRACFRSERAWNWQEQSRYFLRLATNAQRRLWRLKDAAVFDEESRADYDRALAVYSVCQRLWGQPFLREREMFVEQLDLLLGEARAEGEPFDEDRFVQQWRDVVTALRWRYS